MSGDAQREKWFFERIFRYAASSTKLPKENLATEIIAFFLERLPSFRRRFLQEIDSRTRNTTFAQATPLENWNVDTQKPLRRVSAPRPGDEWWINRIPDIALAHSQRCEILVEVKIDAGVTYRDDMSQTEAYQRYLDGRRTQAGIETALVTITRWRNPELAVQDNVQLRFRDLAEYLHETYLEDAKRDPLLAEMAHRWAIFMQSENWIMPDITESHLAALTEIRAIECLLGQLRERLQEVVDIATDEAVSLGWTPGKGSRPSEHWGGRQVWGRELTRAPNDDARLLQLGCHFGEEDGSPRIYGLIFARGYADRLENHPRAEAVKGFRQGDLMIKLDTIIQSSGPLSEVDWENLSTALVRQLGELSLP